MATPSTKRPHVQSLALAREYETLQDARSVEIRIKKLKRHDYIVRMLKDGYIKVKPR
jgi:predicted GIY-YIG superfamily endonuclease